MLIKSSLTRWCINAVNNDLILFHPIQLASTIILLKVGMYIYNYCNVLYSKVSKVRFESNQNKDLIITLIALLYTVPITLKLRSTSGGLVVRR